ncbi:MAG: hypothetical protein JW818_09690 [Pirellulales bacterium]|nr:hypothetical protein [Pirellulales bacterium]
MRHATIYCVGLVAVLVLWHADRAHATIDSTGSILPSDLTWWTSYTDGYVGVTGYGDMTVSLGSHLMSQKCYVGFGSGVKGVVTVDGTGSALTRWTSDGELHVGYQGTGELHILAGGEVSNHEGKIASIEGSKGEATVSGSGSTWTNDGDLSVGFLGTGKLNILAGGSVSNHYGYLGNEFGSTGEATVSGNGSTWTNSNCLSVGYFSEGALLITAGGSVNSACGSVGAYYPTYAKGAVAVSGNGSSWTNDGDLTIGNESEGTLLVDDGGTVRSHTGRLGYYDESSGEVTISGNHSMWINSGDLAVGKYGAGTLSIVDKGLLRVGGILTIDDNEDGDSHVNMSEGGMLALQGEADQSLDAFLALVQGTDDIRYWDADASDWAPISAATPGRDFTLTFVEDLNSDLHGHTVLTVGVVPEPGEATLLLAIILLIPLSRRRRR